MVYQDSKRKIERIWCKFMTNCPCKNCQERSVGCHASCQKYKDWSDEQNRLKQLKYKEQNSQRRWIPDKQYYDSIRRLCKKGR